MRRKRANLAREPALHTLIEKMIELQILAEFEASKYASLADRIESDDTRSFGDYIRTPLGIGRRRTSKTIWMARCWDIGTLI
jgi:hypothetical protein